MAKVSARDCALVAVSFALGAAGGLLTRLPKAPDGNAMLGLAGSLIGAAVAVAAGLIVLWRQFETVDERHLRTVRDLVVVLHIAGMEMCAEDAALDPVKHVRKAVMALQTAKSVARELQASGPRVAAVAQLFEESNVNTQLANLNVAGIGIAPPDLHGRGEAVVELAEEALRMLKNGL